LSHDWPLIFCRNGLAVTSASKLPPPEPGGGSFSARHRQPCTGHARSFSYSPRAMNGINPLVFPLAGAVLSLLCLWAALRDGKRRRLVDNLPTSKTTGVFIGLVELKGSAEAENPLSSYLAGQSCVQYSYTVEEGWSRTVIETYTDSQGRLQ